MLMVVMMTPSLLLLLLGVWSYIVCMREAEWRWESYFGGMSHNTSWSIPHLRKGNIEPYSSSSIIIVYHHLLPPTEWQTTKGEDQLDLTYCWLPVVAPAPPAPFSSTACCFFFRGGMNLSLSVLASLLVYFLLSGREYHQDGAVMIAVRLLHMSTAQSIHFCPSFTFPWCQRMKEISSLHTTAIKISTFLEFDQEATLNHHAWFSQGFSWF